MKVLVVDGDKSTLDLTTFGLHRRGYKVITATDGVQAIHRLQSENPDVVVLESVLPQMDGYSVCRRIRQEIDTPVILTGSTHDDEVVERAFESGADDYIVKPFSHRQLAVRIQAVARRHGNGRGHHDQGEPLMAAGMVLDLRSHEVTRGKVRSRLTPTEFRVLYILAMNVGQVIPSSRLVEYASGYEQGDPSQLKTYVYRIRRKLLMRCREPGSIESVPWIGYKLTNGLHQVARRSVA